MKKSFFLVVFCLAIASFSFGQLRVIVPGANQALNNGDTVIMFGNSTDEMRQYLNLINTGSTMMVLARRDSLLLPMDDTDNQFCWGGFCYSQFTNVSNFSQTLTKGDTVSGFTGEYYPYGHLGSAFIKYTFYNQNGPGPTEAWVVVEYNATPTSVRSINTNISLSAPYPNPTNNNTTLTFNLEQGQHAAMQVYNMLGEVVYTLNEGLLTSGQHTIMINGSALNNGMYLVRLTTDSGTAVQRFVIQR